MTPERLNEITSIASFLLNQTCVWLKQQQDDKGWTVALHSDTSIYFYIASYEFHFSNIYLACDIADEILEELNLWK